MVPKDRKELKQIYRYLKDNDIEWTDAFEIENSRKKGKIDKYKIYEAGKTKNGFRIILVHSSSKEEEDNKRRQKKIDKAIKELKELSPKLNAYHLKTKKEIKAAVDKICKGVKDFIQVKILTDRKQIKVKVSPGRPSSKSVYKNKWDFRHRIEWKKNDETIAEAKKRDGLFPLTTNSELEAAEVLRKYKKQPFLEKRMYTKKTVLEVAPVFLKKEKRIEAILFLYFIALMIVSLIERKIRMNMEKEEIEKIPILPQGMNTKKPTWNNIRYFFRNIHLSEIIRDGVLIQTTVMGLHNWHKEINRLLEVPALVYESVKGNWWQFTGT
ncbi:MAG: IS1634 family transposase [Desulfobacterales bacterium]|nr:IS1634 family transposase [Desulfobacterales bacterium]